MGQVTLADDNGHLSARFCVMRRKRRRLLDLIMRVTVYNPLTASSYWRMAAVLTELRGTQKRVAVDAPPYQSHKFNGAWGLSWGFRRGAYESNRSAEVSLLFSSRWHRQGHLRRVCCPPLPVERTMRCRGDKKTVSDTSVSLFSACLPSHLEGVKQHLRGTPDAVYKWTDGLLMSLPTCCMPVLMLDLNDRLGRPRAEEPQDLIGTVGAGVEGDSASRFGALLRRHSITVPQTFHLATPTLYGSSGRSRIDFVATHPSVQFSRIFVNFTAVRRLQLILAAGPRDHMPLTMDLVTNGMRHCPDPTRGRWDHEKIEEMLSDPVAKLTFLKELETKIRNSSIVAPDDAWENLVQIIQETAGPVLHQGAPRPTRPLALERRRLLLELGTARRLTGSSGDQSLVENAKTEITRVEKQMRRFSRWFLRMRRAMWLEELEEGIRKQNVFTVYRYARLLAGTGIGSKHRRFGQIRGYTNSQIEWTQGLAKEGRG